MGFARGLRASLRQDPDVILVGEIRDHETAELAVRAALTGHLVLSTLHTMDAASSITRLMDMGVAPYLVTSSLALVASQRLVRVPCRECAVDHVEAHSVLEKLGITDHSGRWVRPVGCALCANTGYDGRTAIVEILPITASIRSILLAGGDEDQVRAAARHDGVASLHIAGIEKARLGGTSLEEVLRVAPN
jgi:type II secretory ATPase GspE/PulE/Tfp pilus assembly ATPase PilB-like protein